METCIGPVISSIKRPPFASRLNAHNLIRLLARQQHRPKWQERDRMSIGQSIEFVLFEWPRSGRSYRVIPRAQSIES
jgi:hypothetical protein